PARREYTYRWPVSWLAGRRFTPPSRPGSDQWLVGCRSPLTVAGAATASVPIGYASPCSHFIRRAVRTGGTIGATLGGTAASPQQALRPGVGRKRRGRPAARYPCATMTWRTTV